MEELCSWDPTRLIVGILGGSAGTTRDTFELLEQAERFGARVALFGRKIHLAESPIDIVRFMRQIVARTISPAEAVKAYHGALQSAGLKPARSLDDDLAISDSSLKAAARS
jgi:hypothetical protein